MTANNTLFDWLSRHRVNTPRKTAITYAGNSWSYEQLYLSADRAASQLTEWGFKPGDRMAILAKNCPAMLVWLAACSRLGCTLVPINFRLTPEEVAFVLHDTQPRMLLLQNVLPGAQGLDMSQLPFVAELDADGINISVVKAKLAAVEGETARALQNLALQWDALLIIYTSGTTGRPKGAVLSRSNFLWSIIQYTTAIGVQSSDVTYAVPPLFHIAGLCVLVSPILYQGGTVVLDDQFEAERTLAAISQHRVTKLFLVPQMWAELVKSPRIEQIDISSLTQGLVGSAPCPLSVINFFSKRGVKFQEGFGMSETCSACTLLPDDLVQSAAGSVGFPLAHVKARIVDDDGKLCVANQVGELEVSGPNIMQGYWNRPDANALTLADGWLKTGDLARCDASGIYWIVDRKKDMVISSGENIYPAEIEKLLQQHPAIREVAVIGLPSKKYGEIVTAVLVLEQGYEIDMEQLRNFCSASLASYKHPRELRLIDQLPRNATGKVLKRVLREQYSGSSASIFR